MRLARLWALACVGLLGCGTAVIDMQMDTNGDGVADLPASEDNDFDGLIDADDTDCVVSWDDSEDGAPPSCSDGTDDDNDGWIDADDPDCNLYGDETGFTTSVCNKGV